MRLRWGLSKLHTIQMVPAEMIGKYQQINPCVFAFSILVIMNLVDTVLGDGLVLLVAGNV